MTRSMDHEVTLRLTVVRPPAGVGLRVQRGRDELVPPSRVRDDAISFDVRVRVTPTDGGGHALRGPIVQGPPAARFVYVNSGTYAGQPGSRWNRRAKVPLTGITSTLVAAALASPGLVIEARIEGTGPDGGPACATVPLLADGWRVTTDDP